MILDFLALLGLFVIFCAAAVMVVLCVMTIYFYVKDRREPQ